MSTVRIARRRMYVGGEPAGVDRRGLALALFACVALFACCFAIGRATSPASGPREASSPTLQVAFAGAAIPLRLSSAPAIQAQALASTSPPAPATGARTVAVASTRAIVRTPAKATLPSVRTPVREVASAPSPPQPLPAPASARGTGGGHGGGHSEGGQSKPQTNSGTSFDSSG
jgi:hypothetical protein